MVSGGLGATAGGSSDARANTGTRAFGGPSSEAGKNLHLSTESKAYAPRHIHPARKVGRRRFAARAIPAAPNSSAAVIENPSATEDVAVPIGRERWVGRYQAGLILIDLLAALSAVVAAYLIRFGYPGFEIHSGLYVAVAKAGSSEPGRPSSNVSSEPSCTSRP